MNKKNDSYSLVAFDYETSASCGEADSEKNGKCTNLYAPSYLW